jgi:hypothetical protein
MSQQFTPMPQWKNHSIHTLSLDGSYIYIYIWTGPGESVPIHIHYGTILFLHGDIVHGGGVPKDFYCAGKKYPRLHFYFLTSAADHPNNSIFHESFDLVPFDKDHYHLWDHIIYGS